MISVEKIKEADWGKTHGSCQCCKSYDVICIRLKSTEIRLCNKHLVEVLTKIKELI